MVAFYVKMIEMGRITLEDVPERWRMDVETALAMNT